LIAVGVIIVIVIAMALLIHSCDVSQTKDSLKSYNADVNTLIAGSDNNGAQLFTDLQSGQLTATSAQTLQNKLTDLLANARNNLSTAQSYSAPSQMSGAQTALVQVMQLRAQGISEIATNVVGAASQSTSRDAVKNISVGTSLLYASDVVYKQFVAPDIAKALNGAGIPIGSAAGEQQINGGQIVPDLGWLQSTFISAKLGAQLSTAAANANNAAPGLHGHSLTSVNVDSTQLSPSGTNTIQASPAPTFVLDLSNGGNFNEYDVQCTVKVRKGTGTNTTKLIASGASTIPETTPGESTTCSVTLPSAPTAGTYQVTAGVTPVPGETNVNNNYETFQVTFH
jgi:hypothetical protein